MKLVLLVIGLVIFIIAIPIADTVAVDLQRAYLPALAAAYVVIGLPTPIFRRG